MTAHARFSASGAHRWMRCPASLALEADCPDSSSEFADEGTAAHELAQMALTAGSPVSAFMGRVIEVNGRSFTVDQDMVGYVATYVDLVREIADSGTLFVEQRVDFAAAIGVEPGEGFGTADAIVITHDGELQVHDLKYGRGVRVDAEQNEQLMLYGLGAVELFSIAYDFDRVRVFIHQPRLDHVSEWVCPVDDLTGAFAAQAAQQAAAAIEAHTISEQDMIVQYASPGDKQCRFCKAKASCPAASAAVAAAVVGDFKELTEGAIEQAVSDLPLVFSRALGRKMAVVDFVEGWCKAVRARSEAELLAGREVEGFKIVDGRRGPRQWVNPGEVETTLKAMRLKTEEIYDLKLISPTTAEKLAKGGTIGPRQWSKLEGLVTQSPGKPSVAPVSDPRPASNVADDFAGLVPA